jgi:putative MATE family efflux protein
VLINIGLNYCFIFGKAGFPELGVTGSALATLTARIIQFFCLLFLISLEFRKKNLILTDIRPDPVIFKTIARTGLPIAQTSVIELGSWTVFVTLISNLGTSQMAAQQICMKIKDISYLLGFSLSVVGTTLTGEYIGRKNIGLAKIYCLSVIKIAVLIMGLCGILFFLIPEYLILLFTEDPDVIRFGSDCLRIMALYQISDAVYIGLKGGLNGFGDSRFVRNMVLAGGWGIMLPLAYLFTRILHLGLPGAWIALTIFVSIIAAVLAIRFLKKDWKQSLFPEPVQIPD